ncbi:MAG: aminopeptidase [Peptostreptococcaceae bacterium]|nr:aminopeptidase [Peptostreptococcaceae bacterium]
MKDNNTWTDYSGSELEELKNLNTAYMDFLSDGKTERECVTLITEMAEAKGYINLKDAKENNIKLKYGSKVYANCMDKAIMMINIGKDDIIKGMNILGAHIDSPRLDVKQNPLYENSELAYLDTHYYGGIKKYQWVTLPMAIHGVVVKKDGTIVNIVLGEKPEDPVFFISDLLIHLSAEQLDKKSAKVIEGEQLDIIVGSIPLDKDSKDAVKLNLLKILKDTYDIEEDDFWSAELEVVPAGRAREVGFDRSMIMGYGHDDKVCAYTSLVAMLEVESPKKTSCCLFVDKEEIGSVGATGMQSNFFENTMAEILDLSGIYSELNLRRTLSSSKMLSSDVSAAYDPTFESVFDKKNSAMFGKGLVFNKYTGARGKSGSNDANPEYLAYLRNIFHKHNVTFQSSELGKVDAGGGGTIAYIMALYGMEVVDSGVAVLNMHAPWEVVSKADVHEAKKGYVAFLIEA